MKGERNKREKTNQIKDPVSQHDLNILNSTRIKPDVMTSAETPHHNNSMTAPQTEAAGKGTSCAPSRLRRTQFQPHTYNTTSGRALEDCGLSHSGTPADSLWDWVTPAQPGAQHPSSTLC